MYGKRLEIYKNMRLNFFILALFGSPPVRGIWQPSVICGLQLIDI